MAEMVIIGLMVAGTAIEYQAIRQQGKAAAAQGQAEQDILDYNAQLKIKEAEDIREAARKEAEKFGVEARRLRGAQRVAIARAGVLSTVGTPALLLEETAQELETDRMAILEQGYIRAGYPESEAFGLRFQGISAKARGENIRRGAQLAATGTLLTGIGQVGLAKSQLKK